MYDASIVCVNGTAGAMHAYQGDVGIVYNSLSVVGSQNGTSAVINMYSKIQTIESQMHGLCVQVEILQEGVTVL